MAEGSVAVPSMSFPNQFSNDGSMPQMDEIMRSMLAGLPAFQEIMNAQAMSDDNKSSSDDVLSQSASSQSDRLSHSPNSEHGEVTVGSVLKTPSNQLQERNVDMGSASRESWYQCFSTQSQKELEGLVYSLFAGPRMEKKGDGYEHFECLNRSKFKCRFRLRVKRINDWFIVEERGAHSHTSDLAGVHTQGLAKSIREIVDQSFHEEWPTQLRHDRIEQEMNRLGLPPNPRLNRQIDNRISYLRRVKNLNEVKKIQEEADSMSMVNSAVSQMVGGIDQSPLKGLVNMGAIASQLNASPMASINTNGQFNHEQAQQSIDFNALIAKLHQEAQKDYSSPVKIANGVIVQSEPQVFSNPSNSAFSSPTKMMSYPQQMSDQPMHQEMMEQQNNPSMMSNFGIQMSDNADAQSAIASLLAQQQQQLPMAMSNGEIQGDTVVDQSINTHNQVQMPVEDPVQMETN